MSLYYRTLIQKGSYQLFYSDISYITGTFSPTYVCTNATFINNNMCYASKPLDQLIGGPVTYDTIYLDAALTVPFNIVAGVVRWKLKNADGTLEYSATISGVTALGFQTGQITQISVC